jgi:hypothetical protein
MTAKLKAARTATPLAPFPGAAIDLSPNPLAPPETRRQMLKALGAFHQRLASMEGELGRIRENLQLE